LSEAAIKKELNRIKKAIITHLRNADYKIIRCTNDPVCAIGARENEWRCIVGHLRSISHEIVKELESLPCPDHRIIKKEIWLRNKGEVQFYKLLWDPGKHAWVDQFGEVIRFKPDS